jgi:hypothetical protein
MRINRQGRDNAGTVWINHQHIVFRILYIGGCTREAADWETPVDLPRWHRGDVVRVPSIQRPSAVERMNTCK